MSKVFSFDIFDTCLVRTCGKPINVIYALAYKVLGVDAEFESIRDFVRKRQDAEKKLYKDGIEAPSIAQIYEEFDASYYTCISSSDIMKMEMELEENVLVPVASIVKKINEYRKKGRILFISDMYLPSSFLRSILEKYDIIKTGEPLYVSCEWQSSKYSGGLYDIVKEQEKILFNRWIHFGDDYHNDYLAPRKKGIKAIRIVHDYLEYEKLGEELTPYTSDKSSMSFFSGIMRATRLTLGIDDDAGFLSDVMCGLLLPFVCSCMKDAQRCKIERLYFASRDAYVMFLIARQFFPCFQGMEIKYLYISTHAIYPALFKDGSSEELEEFLRNIPIFKPRSIIKLLGLEKEIPLIEKEIEIDCSCRFDSETARHFVKLLSSGELSEKIRTNGKLQRELLVDYLKQEKFVSNDGKKVALVDIGWHCTSQLYLNEIIGKDALYYYFGVVKNNYFANQMGNYKSFFYTDIIGTPHPKMMECYICKNLENTVLGYERNQDGRIEVKFSNSPIDKMLVNDFQRRKRVLVTASKFYSEYGLLIKHSKEIFDTYSCRIMKSVLTFPSKGVANYLADKMIWDHYVDGHRVIRKLYIHSWIFNRLFYSQYHKKRIQYSNIWLQACISYTYGRWAITTIKQIKKALKMIKQR